MRGPALLVCGAAIAVFATAAQAQSKVKEFDGKWTRVDDPNAPPGGAGGGEARGGARGGGGRGGRGGLGAAVQIEVDASNNKFYIIRTAQSGEMKSTYMLDGTESKNTMQMGGNSMDQMSTTKWAGDTLMITTKMQMGENMSESTMALWISGGNLMVRSSSPGRGGGEGMITTTTYKKG
jgi:hypothetical protein